MRQPEAVMLEHLAYDPESGEVTWKKPAGTAARGARAGTVKSDGYRYIRFKRRCYLEHRVAWCLHYGHPPDGPIDHINMNKADNRLANLRLATVTDNNRNRGPQSNNTTGFKGVYYSKRWRKFVARITANRVTHALGYFDTAAEAASVYEKASKELHGQFARSI